MGTTHRRLIFCHPSCVNCCVNCVVLIVARCHYFTPSIDCGSTYYGSLAEAVAYIQIRKSKNLSIDVWFMEVMDTRFFG